MIQIALPPLLRTPLPDEAHEALRQACVEAITNLTDQSVGMDDFKLALQTLSKLASDYLTALQASLADRAKLRTDLDALAGRVGALEVKPAVRNVAVAYPVSLGLLSVGSRDITLQWDRTLPDTTYDVEWWPSPGLLGAATFTTKSKTTTQVVVTVRNTALIAAGGSLGAIAVRTT